MGNLKVTTIENGGSGMSFFADRSYTMEELNGMWITGRQLAMNFRHRMSEPGYKSAWHVAGDPTLIIVRQGVLRLTLRDGSSRKFAAGDQFIAADYLEPDRAFDTSAHGHKAEVIGDQRLCAVHVKLAALPV